MGGGGGPGPLGFGPPAPVVCFFTTGLRLAVVPRSHWLRCGDVAVFAYDIETSQRLSPLSRRDPAGPGGPWSLGHVGLARGGHAWVAPVSLPRQSLLWLFSAGNVDVSPP